MPELTPELLRTFIKRVEVYEKEVKYSRTCGNKIRIKFTFEPEPVVEIYTLSRLTFGAEIKLTHYAAH